MKLLDVLASWVSGIGEWVLTFLERAPSFTAMYLFTIFGMHETILEFMASGWCDVQPEERGNFSCGGGLTFFSFMAFVLLASTVTADYHRLQNRK